MHLIAPFGWGEKPQRRLFLKFPTLSTYFFVTEAQNIINLYLTAIHFSLAVLNAHKTFVEMCCFSPEFTLAYGNYYEWNTAFISLHLPSSLSYS
jgi:hypothetical protein